MKFILRSLFFVLLGSNGLVLGTAAIDKKVVAPVKAKVVTSNAHAGKSKLSKSAQARTTLRKKANVAQKAQSKKPVVKKQLLELVNKIAFIVYTDDEPIIITLLEVNRPSLDGRKRTKEEVLLERLLYHEAINVFRITIPEDMVDKHIASIKEAHGITDDEIADLFLREGYTFDEGKEELRRSHAIQQLIQHFISSRLVITEKEIQEFHNNNPVKDPASFRIKKGTVSKKDMNKAEAAALEQDGLYEERVTWGVPYWIDIDEIADSKRFITKMQPGQIKVISQGDEYEVIMLVKRKKEYIKKLDERRREIADQLRMPKYEEMLKKFHDDVLKKYEVVDLI